MDVIVRLLYVTDERLSLTDIGTAALAENLSAWTYLRFVPRVNIPVSKANCGTDILGQAVPLPFYFAPTGSTGLADPDGELNVLRAAAATGVPQCVSSVASKKLKCVSTPQPHEKVMADVRGWG